MTARTLLGAVALGMAGVGLMLPPGFALLGLVVALGTLLGACSREEVQPRPSPWALGLTVAAVCFVMMVALFVGHRSPWGFFWLLGPGFVLAAPAFLRWYGGSWRKP